MAIQSRTEIIFSFMEILLAKMQIFKIICIEYNGGVSSSSTISYTSLETSRIRTAMITLIGIEYIRERTSLLAISLFLLISMHSHLTNDNKAIRYNWVMTNSIPSWLLVWIPISMMLNGISFAVDRLEKHRIQIHWHSFVCF